MKFWKGTAKAKQTEKSNTQKLLAFASQIKRFRTLDKIIVSDAGEFTANLIANTSHCKL